MKEKKIISRKPGSATSPGKQDAKSAEIKRLKKELKIEAALEKVRVRGMAMKNSEELGLLIGTLFKELTKLDLVLTRCVIWIIDPKTNDAVWWMANSEDPSHPMSYVIPYHKEPPWLAFMKEWKKRRLKWVYDLKGPTKKKWDDHLFSKTGLSKMPNFIKKGMRAPDRILLSATFNNFGGMNVASLKPLPDEQYDILLRFAKVFDQTHTRFLDLQKAETQAREAEIQLALERVRARTMAMHKSEELASVASVLFHQLQELNLPALRRCLIGIVDEKNKKLQSWHTSLLGDSTQKVIEHPIDGHPVIREKISGWRKKKPFSIDLSPARLNDFIGYLIKHGFEYNKGEKPATKLIQNHAPFKYGYLEVATHESIAEHDFELLQRFAKVFEQTYTRFLDLQKAEAQAREAQIQLALERVRARTMAMQKSIELREVVGVLYSQLEGLNFGIDHVLIAIANRTLKTFDWWGRGFGMEVQPTMMTVQYIDHPRLNSFLSSLENGTDYDVFELKGELKKSWDEHLFNHTDLKYLPEDVKETMKNTPEIYLNIAYMIYGGIEAAGPKPLTEEQASVLKRFAVVFEQTYTRFLDLQKAEAQAREAQIEAALEKVRSRSLAMHKSEELLDIIIVVSEQLEHLNIKFSNVSFGVNSPEYDLQLWMAVKGYPNASHIQWTFLDNPGVTKLKEAQKQPDKVYSDVLTQAENNEWLRHIFKCNPGFDIFSKENRTRLLKTPGYARSIAIMKDIFLVMGNYAAIPYTNEVNAILKRFANVFEQTYTRFLDLQKAEAQSRESQIQLALERVRARTMAMQKSDELLDAASLLFEQVKELGCDPFSCGFVLLDKNKPDGEFFMSAEGKFQPSVFIPNSDESAERNMYLHWLKKEKLYTEDGEGKELVKHFEYMMSLPGKTGEMFRSLNDAGIQFPKWQRWHAAYFTYGYLLFITKEPFEETSLFPRFASVFEQTYTRFLDLQKAEAQAREAQIEASLERIRSKTMAMQKQQELQGVMAKVFEELQLLGFEINACCIIIFNKENFDSEYWFAGFEDKNVPRRFYLSYLNHPYYHAQLDPWREGILYNTVQYSGELKNSMQDWFEENGFYEGVPEENKKALRDWDGWHTSNAYMNHGLLGVAANDPLPDEKANILRRFAKVFEQTYTRFLDLQKAEAQAREAEIELALERVRARTMAMQKSEEIASILADIFKGLAQLDMTLVRVLFWIFNSEKNSFSWWSANSEVENTANCFEVPFNDHPVFLTFLKAWKEKTPLLLYDFEGELKDSWQEYLFNETDLGQLPDEVKKGMRNEGKICTTSAISDYGLVMTGSAEPLSEQSIDIIQRFGNTFQQSYTRYRDVQKAEAQAREAQIETALERTRTQSMIMQHSKELDDTLRVFHEQVQLLGINSAFSFLWLPDEEKEKHIFWAIWEESKDGSIVFKNKAINYPLDRNEPATKQCLIDWKGDEPVVSYAVSPEGVENYFAAWQELIDGVETLRPVHFRNGLYYVEAFMKYGCFGVMAAIDLTADEKKILGRFARVFEQTYTRFLDLKKAEAQAREAKIEAALERVRSKTMAMHSSDDVTLTTETMFNELQKLGINNLRCGIANIHHDKTFDSFGITNMDGGITMRGFGLFDMNEHPIWQRWFESWKNKEEVFIVYIAGQEKEEYFNIINKYPNYLPQQIVQFPDSFLQTYHFDQGAVWAYSLLEHSKAERDIMKRFVSVFSLTFRRYLDLQKAEAQAREAQIEASLERIRSRTMGMQKTDELKEIVALLYEESNKFGFESVLMILNTRREEDDGFNWWFSANEQTVLPQSYFIPDLDEPVLRDVKSIWESGNPDGYIQMGGSLKKEHDRRLFTETGLRELPDHLKEMMRSYESVFLSIANMKNGFIEVAANEFISGDRANILQRYAKVFEQTYTRFLDLQKSEAQAREAKIEASLEKVRSRSLAMHTADELQEVVLVIVEKLQELGVILDANGITLCTYFPNSKDVQHWIASSDFSHVGKYLLPYFDHIIFREAWDSKESGDPYFSKAYSVEEKNSFFKYAFEHSDYKKFPDDVKQWIFQNDKHILSFAWQKNSAILIPSNTGIVPDDAQKAVLIRFSKVFEQAYVRFMDLQKAEAQAREATIEAALEKVRGKAMAMHNSNDLSVTASLVFTELRKLGINPIRCGFGSLHKESRRAQLYSATSSDDGDSLSLVGWVELSGHTVLEKIYASWLSNEEYYPELIGEQLKMYYESLLAGLPVPVPDWQSGQKQYGNFFPFSVGCLYAWSEVPYNDNEIKILKRFASIIDLTFRRYLELQTAEANAKEAVKQAALDRIRADIASMRSISDLDRITPLIWNELTILGIPFIRCGVFIMDDSQQLIHTFLSTPDGKAIAAFHLPYDTPGNIGQVVSSWKDTKNYIDHWNQSAFNELADVLVQQGAIASTDQYLSSIPQGGFYLHFLPFLQGMLYVGNTNQLSDEEINLIQSVADAFSTAYARYEDFNKLEAAKQQVDKTLVDLKQAQQQLVQSEKMASLGELTAGIAHEIQNPLNFVNNFSEVSKELLDEMKSELDNGNLEDAKEIMNDVIQNLEKINHHGKRADGIVKGMLQHSRSSSATKELTDINALCDEYLRLSYHGLRAKDKSFNASTKTDFDESLEKINIVPQDIGRVVLNLLTNAFYVVSEKAKQNIPGYEPTVSVSTKKVGSKIEIKVSDNGNGIPQKVLDKIFQPFFTTKPTGSGTGLGLSLSYDIIKAHGGEIKVETKEDEGSEFIILLRTN